MAMVEELRVYLDHHIERDDFLYKRSDKKMSKAPVHGFDYILRLKDLYGDKSMVPVLRKPDFQRATWAWSPNECVLLLESIVNEQIIPSIIMWLSPEGRWYVLDGGHRISVLLAWLRDDWGEDTFAVNDDVETVRDVKDAASEVRRLMEKYTIGNFESYKLAFEKIENSPEESREFEEDINSENAKKAEFYRGVLSGSIGFPLQWVKGDYNKAEESFLKINSSGRSLTDWERKLVENRSSSFARVVMSLSDITRAEHCWPTKVPREENREQIKPKVEEILEGITKLNRILFEPPHDSLFTRIQQPIVAESRREPDKKPAYLAELLTIIKGGKGQIPQTEKLIKQEKTDNPAILVNQGLQLVRESLDVFDHVVGPSPKSLAIVPALYFYTDTGKYIRGLLYGFIYWLFSGGDKDILLQNKLLLSAYRESFEQVLILNKKGLIANLGRKIGSGSEVTMQTARYFERLLSLLQEHNGYIKSEAFVADYHIKFEDIAALATSKSSSIKLPYVDLPRCSVCKGFIDLSGIQVNSENILTYAHPFCESQRTIIERIQRGEQVSDLLAKPKKQSITKPQQLSFIEFEIGTSFEGTH